MRSLQNEREKMHINRESVSQNVNERIQEDFQSRISAQQDLDYLSKIKTELKMLWSEYIQCQDQYGFNDTARDLREKYFSLLRHYRHNKNWKQILSNG